MAYPEVVAALDSALVVLTAASGGERSGCLVGFHSAASIEPPRYAVWVSRANHTFGVVAGATHVAVHVLRAPADLDLAERFGGTTADDGVDKFAGLDVDEGPGGAPLLARCPTRMVLARVELLDAGGDHVCFLGEPVEAAVDGAGPVVRLADAEGIEAGHPAD